MSCCYSEPIYSVIFGFYLISTFHSSSKMCSLQLKCATVQMVPLDQTPNVNFKSSWMAIMSPDEKPVCIEVRRVCAQWNLTCTHSKLLVKTIVRMFANLQHLCCLSYCTLYSFASTRAQQWAPGSNTHDHMQICDQMAADFFFRNSVRSRLAFTLRHSRC